MQDSKFMKVISILLAAIILTNCKAYYPVRKPAANMDYQHEFMLHKGALKFRLENVNVKSDTLFATISHTTAEPPKGNRMVVVLKNGIEPEKDPTGQLMIPFSSIDFIEMYEIDRDKSREITTVVVSSVMAWVLVLFFIISFVEIDVPIAGDAEDQ